MHAKWRTPPVTYLSIFPWLLCEISIGSKPFFFFFFFTLPSQLSWLAVSPHTLTLANALKYRQPHAVTSTHTLLKSCRKAEADHIMQIAVACWDVRGIRKEMKRGDRGEQGKGKKKTGRGRERRSKGAGLRGCGHVFQKLLCSWPPPVPLHACLAVVTEYVTCRRTPQRSTR